MTPTLLVEAEQLTKTYPGSEVPVVSGVSFTLEAGEILALLGPNGAGKTTTIKMLLGLVTSSAGMARVLDCDMADPAEMRWALQQVGAVLEGSRNAYWPISAVENLRYFGGLHGLPRKVIDQRAGILLETLGLAEHQHRPVKTFSRGMQQKVALANALIHEPQILVLDEPTLGLDVESARQLEATIKEAVKQGKGVVLTTHVMSLAQRLADRVLVIHHGEVVAHDRTEALLRQFVAQDVIEVTVQGRSMNGLTEDITASFPDISIRQDQNTVLSWLNPQQKQVIDLYTLLDQAGCQVLSVARREPDLEEVFLSLTGKG
jgi:ABC-2 type transport system ATP-binding protein